MLSQAVNQVSTSSLFSFPLEWSMLDPAIVNEVGRSAKHGQCRLEMASNLSLTKLPSLGLNTSCLTRGRKINGTKQPYKGNTTDAWTACIPCHGDFFSTYITMFTICGWLNLWMWRASSTWAVIGFDICGGFWNQSSVDTKGPPLGLTIRPCHYWSGRTQGMADSGICFVCLWFAWKVHITLSEWPSTDVNGTQGRAGIKRMRCASRGPHFHPWIRWCVLSKMMEVMPTFFFSIF